MLLSSFREERSIHVEDLAGSGEWAAAGVRGWVHVGVDASGLGRQIKVTAEFDLLHAARAAAGQPDWQHTYTRYRPMVERSIAWIVAKGHRRVRYRGIERNQLWLDHRVAAVNLRQLIRSGLTKADGTWAIA